ncbi:Formamidopyrimidine-DNA glycosylase N-terminal domain-containing protein [Armillaria borealis]|uniref:Formamidopyrimidine-DNA glycosylase N-terminal domain-containing protein n=1 Tax=Armillaria borealis TaxID=47425 RepID=A0AA39K9J4_9AGAR|nr:Formamidopyrimidine-DNA glycosylase N-terminal domain-containing protein [Armillaria borealis]
MDSGVFSNYLNPQNAMPELPGKKIVRVESFEDAIVYSGTTHTEFARELTGRMIDNVGRYGKVFYLELSGGGRMPVMHFGMTGMLQVKGQLATYYKETPRTASTDWPPRFVKFILHLEATSDAGTTDTIELAFLDARRLGRIRLCSSPTKEPPISELGFDPILSMPSLEAFLKLVVKRSCPIKALLLDQSFSAGVGNWVAGRTDSCVAHTRMTHLCPDEILYHAHVHPEQRCNTLTEEQVARLREKMVYVCETAAEANADDTKFPDNWLFKHRWGKGKKAAHNMVLPSGEPATIKWITVGGRTSAFVFELQTTPPGPARTSRKRVQKREEADDSDLPPLTESESEEPPAKRLTRSRSQKTDVSSPRKGKLSRASKKREK